MLIDISKYGYMNEKCSFDLTEFDSNFEFQTKSNIGPMVMKLDNTT